MCNVDSTSFILPQSSLSSLIQNKLLRIARVLHYFEEIMKSKFLFFIFKNLSFLSKITLVSTVISSRPPGNGILAPVAPQPPSLLVVVSAPLKVNSWVRPWLGDLFYFSQTIKRVFAFI